MSCGEEPPFHEKNECGGYYCSMEHGHIDCKHAKAEMQAHQCCTPGLVMEGVVLTEHTNSHGQHYWKAVAKIGAIFGSEVEGELTAIGTTKEQALEHMSEERRKLHESIHF